LDFYISWSPSDPMYPDYFPNCNILLSPQPERRIKIKNWSHKPNKLIIDSRAFYYLLHSNQLPPQKTVFEQQMRIIQDTNTQTYLSHLDQPIIPGTTSQSSTYSMVEKTLANAYDFIELYHKANLDKNPYVEPMGVIQGIDLLSIQFCAKELLRLGFKTFGLGSLAKLFNPPEILDRVKAASDVVGENSLHLFGISRLDIIKELKLLKIASLDSTRPMMAAIYNGLFYSHPFRTYGITSARNSSSYPEILNHPLPCECPICQTDPHLLMEPGKKKSVNARAVHNYYHLIKHLVQV